MTHYKHITYSRWDEIVLKINDTFGYDHEIYVKLKVTVLGYNGDENNMLYLCYVSPTQKIPIDLKTIKINRHHVTHFGVDEKFIGDIGCFITDADPIYRHIPTTPGETCDRCKVWVDYAEKTNDKYFCIDCRINPYR